MSWQIRDTTAMHYGLLSRRRGLSPSFRAGLLEKFFPNTVKSATNIEIWWSDSSIKSSNLGDCNALRESIGEFYVHDSPEYVGDLDAMLSSLSTGPNTSLTEQISSSLRY